MTPTITYATAHRDFHAELMIGLFEHIQRSPAATLAKICNGGACRLLVVESVEVLNAFGDSSSQLNRCTLA